MVHNSLYIIRPCRFSSTQLLWRPWSKPELYFINANDLLQLCLALADLALQMATWKNAASDMMQKYVEMSPFLYNLTTMLLLFRHYMLRLVFFLCRFGNNVQQWHFLVELLMVMPEEVCHIMASLPSEILINHWYDILWLYLYRFNKETYFGNKGLWIIGNEITFDRQTNIGTTPWWKADRSIL